MLDNDDTFTAAGFLAGILAGGATLALPGCSNASGPVQLRRCDPPPALPVEQRAFARLTAAGGFWDQEVATLGLDSFLGERGEDAASILTSSLFKRRLERAFADIAIDAADRAAPIVADTVRMIGYRQCAGAHSRRARPPPPIPARHRWATRLVDAMVPEVGKAMRIAQEPLVGQLLSALTGVDVAGLANSFADTVDDVIWGEIGNEEAAIRADPKQHQRPGADRRARRGHASR